jgi:hypothetical protein
MTLDDFSIYGISVSILISIVSAGTALIAVYFTFKQAKISHNQFELELKKVEKPRVVENIRNTINSIEQELNLELKAINNIDVFWVAPNERNNYYMGPLVFPLSQLKFFHDNFLSNFLASDIQRSREISTMIPAISTNLKKRHEIYHNVDQQLQNLLKEIEESHYEKRREILFAKLNRFRMTVEVDDKGDLEPFFHDIIETNTLTEEVVDPILKSMIISTLFKPLKKEDFRLGGLGFSTLTKELYDKIPEFLKSDPVPNSDHIIKSIKSLLDSLKILDENMLRDIKRIKDIYREIYSLKESELNPPQGLFV